MKIKCFEVICLTWQQNKFSKSVLFSSYSCCVKLFQLSTLHGLLLRWKLDAGKLVFALIFRTKWIFLSVICMMSLHQSLIGSKSTSKGFQPPLVNLDAMHVNTYFILTSFVMVKTWDLWYFCVKLPLSTFSKTVSLCGTACWVASSLKLLHCGCYWNLRVGCFYPGFLNHITSRYHHFLFY